ncbi:zinc-dependent alcohol dehydrogenase family protein [Burkholderia pseudomallei]|uniref:zinc-dependent alcohol dehydrogenase family protein n=1 Tax=Burkholderia pseudomallei TaxID=28450 RepID=UPI00406385EB
MKQIRFDEFGAPARVASLSEVAEPGAPSPWEVLVDIEACTVNPADLARLAGRYGELPKLPATLGLEAVGRVAICGESVRNVAVGDRVILVGNDNWCQRRRLAESLVHKIPFELDPLQAASLKVGACTALELVRRHATLDRGAWLVQTAPLSTVGRAVMQIARHDGLRTLNIVRRPDAVDAVLVAGGDVALVDGPDLAEEAKASMGGALASLAFDAVGGEGLSRIGGLLEPGSTLIHYGMLSGEPIRLASEELIFRDIRLHGYWLTKRLSRLSYEQRDALLSEAVGLLAAGVLRTEVAATYPLEAIATALRHADEPGHRGRVYLLPNGPLHTTSFGGDGAS